MKTMLTYFVAAALFAAQAPVHAGLFDKDPPAPVVVSSSMNPEDAFKQLIDDGAAFRHVSKAYSGPSKKVAIGTIKLNFITDASDTAATKEFMGKATVSTSSAMKLVGIDVATMSAIADNFHNALRAKLVEQGYEVVSQEELLNNADFKSAVADTKAVDSSLSGSVTKVYANGTGNINTFGMRNFSYNLKMPVVVADLTLNFAAFDKETNRWADGGYKISAEIRSKVLSTVRGAIEIKTEDGGGSRFDFAREAVLPGAIADKVEEDVKSKGAVATEVGLKVLGALLGSTDSSSSTSYTVTAIKNYREVVSSDLNLLAGVLVNAMQKR